MLPFSFGFSALRSLTMVLPLQRRSRHYYNNKRANRDTITNFICHPHTLIRRYRLLLFVMIIFLIFVNTLVLFLNAHALGRSTLFFSNFIQHQKHGGQHLQQGKFGSVKIPEERWDAVWENAKVFVDSLRSRNGSVLERRNVNKGREVLKEVWEIPEIVVNALSEYNVESLLFRLRYMEAMLEDSASGIGPVQLLVDQSDGTAVERRASKARCVFVHVQNGLGNRLRAMGSGIALAKRTGRVPVVVWERDAHLSAGFGDLFNPTPVSATRNPEHVIYRNILIVEKGFPSWKDLATHEPAWRPYNYMLKDGKDTAIHFPLPIIGRGVIVEENTVGVDAEVSSNLINLKDPISPLSHIYLKTAYVVRTIPPVVGRRDVDAELRRLIPVGKIIELYNSVPAGQLRRSIGVHIRSRGLKRDNVGIDMDCEYTSSGAHRTDYWRRRSGKDVFASKLKSYVRRDKNATFFIAADDVQVVEDLRQMLPGRVLSIARKCDDRSPACVQYAVADLLCLSRTKKMIGSHWSSFTETAGRLGRKRVLLSGKHFGRKPMAVQDFFGSLWAKIQDRYRFFSTCKPSALPAELRTAHK